MGSVLSQINCPNCNSDRCTNDLYYKTGEEFTFCPDCGYDHKITIRRDEEGNRLYHEESRDLIFDEMEITNPYGVGEVVFKDGRSLLQTIVDEENYLAFAEYVRRMEKPDIERVLISRYVNGTHIKGLLFHAEGVDYLPQLLPCNTFSKN